MESLEKVCENIPVKNILQPKIQKKVSKWRRRENWDRTVANLMLKLKRQHYMGVFLPRVKKEDKFVYIT